MAFRDGESEVTVDGTTYVKTVARGLLHAVSEDQLPEGMARATAAKTDAEYAWMDGTNPDLVWCKFILDCEGDNKNWDYMPRPSLMKSFATAKWKPFDSDHIIQENASLAYADENNVPANNTIYGVMTSSALANYKGELLTPKQVKALEKSDIWDRATEDKLCVVGYAALWNFLFPKTIKDVITAAAQGVMHVSMERWIKKYDFLYRDPNGEMKSISKEAAEANGYHEMWQTQKEVNGYPIWRRSLQFVYGGVASTFIPANDISTFLPEETDHSLAVAAEKNPTLKILMARHDEVHRTYAESSDDTQRATLRSEHEWLHKCIAEFRR